MKVSIGVLISAAVSVSAAPSSCPSNPISIAGADSLRRLTDAWKLGFTQENCPTAEIQIEGGGSFVGAARVCGTHNSLVAVDIGGMARRFNYGDATTEDGWKYQCQRSPRKAIELHVAQEGIAIVTSARGIAADCIERLGGLSLDQLRWIFSGYTTDQLLNEEWEESSVPFPDGNEDTHLWSELNEECEPVEIMLSGVMENDPSYQFFIDVVFEGRDEGFRHENQTIRFENQTNAFYRSSSVEDLANFLVENDSGVSFFQLGLLFSTELRRSIDKLSGIPVMDRGTELIDPKAAAFETSAYPLSRGLYLNVLDDEESLANMKPFIEYALSDRGNEIVKESGFWPIHDWELIVMATRAQIKGGIPMSDIQQSCGPDGGQISVAGSTTVLPVTRIFSEVYKLGCPEVETKLEGGGSSVGAGRVCSNPEKGSPVDIGNMSRGWKTSEASQSREFTYKCLKGDTTRSVVRVDVAQDGVTIIMQRGGAADECMQIIGGLTFDQLRWIYSNYNDMQLEKSGWDPKSLKNSDNNSMTHYWSELDSRCPQTEIRLSGDFIGDGTYTSFVKTVLVDHRNGEDIDVNRPYGYRVGSGFALASYVRLYGDAVSYTSFNYYFDNKDSISAAAIQNDKGVFVHPSENTISDGTYPNVRRIWMNLLNEEQSLQNTVPMIKFGFNHPRLVAATGFVPLMGSDSDEMIQRLDLAQSGLLGDWGDEDDESAPLGLILGLAVGGVAVILGFLLFVRSLGRTGSKESTASPRRGTRGTRSTRGSSDLGLVTV